MPQHAVISCVLHPARQTQQAPDSQHVLEVGQQILHAQHSVERLVADIAHDVTHSLQDLVMMPHQFGPGQKIATLAALPAQ